MLARLVDGPLNSSTDSQGRLFIDRDGFLFLLVLQWLRDPSPSTLPSSFHTLQALKRESEFYQVRGLTAALAIRLPGSESPAEIAVQGLKSQLHDALHMYRQSAHWTQLSLADWQKFARGLRNNPETSNALIGLRIQLNGYLSELTIPKDRYKTFWVAYCDRYRPDDRLILAEQTKYHGLEDLVEAVVEERYNAAHQLHRAIGDSSVTLPIAEASVAALNGALACDARINTEVIHVRRRVAGKTNHRIPVSSTARPGFWIDCKRVETSMFQVDLDSSSPLINLPWLTTDGVIDKRQQNLRAMVLSLERSAWHEPPNDHWAAAHDELVIELWDAYLIATGQRSAYAVSLSQQVAALPALRAYSSRQQHSP
jgi:BTB/POZ domain